MRSDGMATGAAPISNDATTPGGSPVGALLRAHRIKAGYDLGELSRQLRIRSAFLDAIENGRFGDLPGHAYALGFVKTYAEYFGLDAQEIIRRYRNETGESRDTQVLHFPAPVAERGTPRGAVILIGLIIAGVAYGAWYVNTVADNALVKLVAPVPERLRHLLAGDTESAGQAAGVTVETPAPEKPVVVVPVPPRTPPPAASVPSSPETPSAQLPPPPPTAGAAPALPPAVVAAAVAEPAAVSPSPAAAGGHVQLRAKADAWVQVRNPVSRTVLLSRVLKAGEVFDVPPTPGLLLTVGNAGGVDVTVDGELLPPLGRDGAVRRNLPLDAALLRQGLSGGD